MNDQFPINSPTPLEFTPVQRRVIELLRKQDSDRYQVSKWYEGAIYALSNPHNPDRISQAAQSLREVFEKLSWIVDGQDTFVPSRRGHSKEKDLRRADKVSVFIEKKDPLIASQNEQLLQERRDEFHQLWEEIQNFAHHGVVLNDESNSRFLKALKETDLLILEWFEPTTAEDQIVLNKLVGKAVITSEDADAALRLMRKCGSNYVYFFKHVENSEWFPLLRERKLFDFNPSNSQQKKTRDRSYWWPIEYLLKTANSKSQEVVEVIKGIPKTENPRILEPICDIICRIENVDLSLKLKRRVYNYIDLDSKWASHERIVAIITHWVNGSACSMGAGFELIRKVIRFYPDPESTEKAKKKLEEEIDYFDRLKPDTKLKDWEYHQMLEQGIHPLMEQGSLQITQILIEETARVIELGKFPDELEKCGEKDASEYWCPKLFDTHRDHAESKELLANAMTFACEMVYEKQADQINALDELLRGQRWRIFNRLRWHLYGKYPSEQTLPWIRTSILEFKNYSKRELPYEFQIMIRSACEHFGTDLLETEALSRIVSEIRSGPSREKWKEWMDGRFTEGGFKKRKAYFHRKQLRPFCNILSGEDRIYYDDLEAQGEEPLSDEDYLLWKGSDAKVGFMSSKSPLKLEEFQNKSDAEVLDLINNWNKPTRDSEDWSVEITVNAFSNVFGSYFTDSVVGDPERLQFWLENKEKIKRPSFVRSILEAAKQRIEKSEFLHFDTWLNISEWVLTHPDENPVGNAFLSDESFEHPNWNSCRRAVVDLLEVSFKKEVDVSIDHRDRLFLLLRRLCLESDYCLDENIAYASGERDYLSDAINHTRSRALENLAKYGYWVQDHLKESEPKFDDIESLLEERFSDEDIPVTLPEYAILGLHFFGLKSLLPQWVGSHKNLFFDQTDLSKWSEAFRVFIGYTGPRLNEFEFLRNEFEFALSRFESLLGEIRGQSELIDKVGQHLFSYYIWGKISLDEGDNLLDRFYQQSAFDKKYWGNLFRHVGHSLMNSGPKIEENIETRIVAFFDYRVAKKEPVELEEFSFWLRAECLSPEWRLRSFFKSLISPISDDSNIYMTLESLEKLLEQEPALVLECFDRLIERVISHRRPFIKEDCAETILRAGLKHPDADIKHFAENALENLLKMGYHGFLKLIEEDEES